MLDASREVVLKEIRSWFDSSRGKQFLKTESSILDQLLSGLFGYHLLQISVTDVELFSESPVGHKFSMGISQNDLNPFVGSAQDLPFQNDSVDVVLLHHVLDFFDAPQHILREACRVSIPAGYLVITGFNPWSMWGFLKHATGWRGRAPFNGKFIRPGRLLDWLTLLDFKIDHAIYGLYSFPFDAQKQPRSSDFSQGLSRNTSWPFGSVYVIVARKQVGGVTPIRPVWRKQRRLGNISAIRPTSSVRPTNRGSTS